MNVNMATMNVIMTTILMAGVSVCCIGIGISHFNSIYPTRYGKNHLEINGIIVGEQEVKVGCYRCIKKILSLGKGI